MVIRVAVFGGSKNTARHVVVQGLEKGGYEFKLLLRKPADAEYTQEQMDKLTYIEGDALNIDAVQATIVDTDVVLFAIGSSFDTKRMQVTSPTVCTDAMKVLLEAMKNLEHPPQRIVCVSTTGVDNLSDVPILFRPFYKFVLHTAHIDKKNMEALVTGEDNSVKDYIIVRPSLLTNGERTEKYRSGEQVVGYTISRLDVAHFILHECLEPTTWLQKKVVVTY